METEPKIMETEPKIMGRTELALCYFPHLHPYSAWRKLRDLLLEDRRTSCLATMRRRYFTAVELRAIFDLCGRP